jgi:hypothetical protein
MRFRKKLLVACLAAALASGPLLAGTDIKPALSDAGLRTRASHVPEAARPLAAHAESVGTLVSNCDDAGPGSLRQVIQDAHDGDRINLRALACSTITLDSAIDVHANELVVVGAGADRLTIDGHGSTPLFNVDAPYFIMGFLRLKDGYSTRYGGWIESTGGVYIGYSEVSGCHSHTPSYDALGGAVFAAGHVDIMHSVVTSNLVEATGATNALGGAIFAGGGLEARYSTFDSNEARSAKYSTGGAAYVSAGDGVLFQTTISNNVANNVGGISFVRGGVDMFESTISGNVAHTFVGGMYAHGQSHVEGSTIAFNCAGFSYVSPGYYAAAGFQAYQSGIELYRSIAANNSLCTGDGTAYDIGYQGDGFVHGDHDLVGTANVTLPSDTIRSDPMLAPLASNGASIRTHALLPGSPAIDAGAGPYSSLSDERGTFFPRFVGTHADIGAYESQADRTVLVATSCDDSGPGTLRDLVGGAISGDVVDLSELACSRITLTSGPILLPQPRLTIKGPGSELLTIDGGGTQSILLGGAIDFGLLMRVEGIAFENGYSPYGVAGGACVSTFGSFIGVDTRFDHCRSHPQPFSSCQGGALRVWGDAAISDSQFFDNTCEAGYGSTYGGAIWTRGHLALDHSVLSGNSALADTLDNAKGGAFFAFREAKVAFSTISGNHATLDGAGYAYRLAVTESTVSGNTADVRFGGLAAYMGRIYNSTVALNTTPAADGSASGFFATVRGELWSSILFGNTTGSDAYDVGSLEGVLLGAGNLVGASPRTLPPDTLFADPLLGPLQDNGGPTPTHSLGIGSPAIDAGNNVLGLVTDQRGDGHPRIVGEGPDIGAFEVSFSNQPPLAVDDSFATDENVALTVTAPGVLANDSDPDGDALSVALIDDVAHGSLTLNADGSFAYVPATDFVGTDSFTYEVNDGDAASNDATVTIEVQQVVDTDVVFTSGFE